MLKLLDLHFSLPDPVFTFWIIFLLLSFGSKTFGSQLYLLPVQFIKKKVQLIQTFYTIAKILEIPTPRLISILAPVVDRFSGPNYLRSCFRNHFFFGWFSALFTFVACGHSLSCTASRTSNADLQVDALWPVKNQRPVPLSLWSKKPLDFFQVWNFSPVSSFSKNY